MGAEAHAHAHTHTHTRTQNYVSRSKGGVQVNVFHRSTGRVKRLLTLQISHTYTSSQQHADTQREMTTLLIVRRHSVHSTQMLTYIHVCMHARTHKGAQFRKSIWDQETNYLNYFPFSFITLFYLFSCFLF